MPVDREQLDELHQRMLDGLSELTTGTEWAAWLQSARRFHRYSAQNQMLLAIQGATGLVASYRTWQRIPAADGSRCQVARGEKGLTILAPMTVTTRDIDEATGDEVVVGRGGGTRLQSGQGLPSGPTRVAAGAAASRSA
jgi:hypothetical protein